MGLLWREGWGCRAGVGLQGECGLRSHLRLQHPIAQHRASSISLGAEGTAPSPAKARRARPPLTRACSARPSHPWPGPSQPTRCSGRQPGTGFHRSSQPGRAVPSSREPTQLPWWVRPLPVTPPPVLVKQGLARVVERFPHWRCWVSSLSSAEAPGSPPEGSSRALRAWLLRASVTLALILWESSRAGSPLPLSSPPSLVAAPSGGGCTPLLRLSARWSVPRAPQACKVRSRDLPRPQGVPSLAEVGVSCHLGSSPGCPPPLGTATLQPGACDLPCRARGQVAAGAWSVRGLGERGRHGGQAQSVPDRGAKSIRGGPGTFRMPESHSAAYR